MITGSADHTILIYQLPLYFPSELIRGDRSVDRISLLSDGAKEKFSQGDLLEDYDEEPLTASLPNEKVEKREDQYSKVQSLVEKSSRKLNSMGRLVLQEFEKECEDINGWDV